MLKIYLRKNSPLFLLLMSMLLVGCGSMTPWNRELAAPHRAGIKELKIYTAVDLKGFGVGYWSHTPVATGHYQMSESSLVGAEFARSPAEIANSSAASLAKAFYPEEIERTLGHTLSEQLRKISWLNTVHKSEPFLINETALGSTLPDDSLLTAVLMYKFSPDLRHFIITADLRVLSKRYRYLDKAIDDVKGSPIYMNRIYYISDRMTAPGDKSSQQIRDEISEIRSSYLDKNGNLDKNPTKISEMNKRIAAVKADRHTSTVAGELADVWTEDNGERIRKEVATGVSELTRLLIKELNGEAVTIKAGKSYAYSIIEENEGREVRRQKENFGDRLAGTLTSLPSDYRGYAENVVIYARPIQSESR